MTLEDEVRALSIQVQPVRAPGIVMDDIVHEFQSIAEMSDLVKHHAFSDDHESVHFFNFTFGTPDAKALWGVVQDRLYNNERCGGWMRQASMAMCSSEQGWDDYVLLFHFDPDVKTGNYDT
jgi:hypothetical protein